MVINDIQMGTDLATILNELQSQLHINKIDLLRDIKDTPDNIQVTCPYHKGGQERKPSMGIKKTDGTCHCFTCGQVATLQQMISHCFGRTDDMIGAFGWRWLMQNFVSLSVESRKPIDLGLTRGESLTKTVTEYVSEEELDSYRYIHPYMYKRKLTDSIIDLFDIGYDKKTECITFPIRDITGHTLFIARRSVKTKFFNYPAGVEKPVYGLYEIYRDSRKEFNCIDNHVLYDFPNEVIICESMIDALTCWVYGKFAVALNGLGNDLQFRQLNEMPNRKFILATDADDAGMRARERLKKNIHGKIITEYKWDVTVAKDINDMSEEMFKNLREVY